MSNRAQGHPLTGPPRRRALAVEGVEHFGQPIPMAVEIGGMVFSSGIFGVDPASGQLPPDAARQAELMFAHVRSVLEEAGAGVESIAKMTVFTTENEFRAHINHEWLRMFPDPHDRPARHTFVQQLPPGMLVECEFIAVVR